MSGDVRSADNIAPLPGGMRAAGSSGPRRPVIPNPQAFGAAGATATGADVAGADAYAGGMIDVSDAAVAAHAATAAYAGEVLVPEVVSVGGSATVGSFADGVSPFGVPQSAAGYESAPSATASYEQYAPPGPGPEAGAGSTGSSGWDDAWDAGTGAATTAAAGMYGAGPASAYGPGPTPAYGAGPAPAYGTGAGGTALMAPPAPVAVGAGAAGAAAITDDWGADWDSAPTGTATATGTIPVVKPTAGDTAKRKGLSFGSAAGAAGLGERIAQLKDKLTDESGKPRREVLIGGVVFLAIVPLIVTLAVWSMRSNEARRDAKSVNSFQVPGSETAGADGIRSSSSSSSNDYPADLGPGYVGGLNPQTPGEQTPYTTLPSSSSSSSSYSSFSNPNSYSSGGSSSGSTYRPTSGSTGSSSGSASSGSGTPTPTTPPTTAPPAPKFQVNPVTNAAVAINGGGIYGNASLNVAAKGGNCSAISLGSDTINVCLTGPNAARVQPQYKLIQNQFGGRADQGFNCNDASCTSRENGLVVTPRTEVKVEGGTQLLHTTYNVGGTGWSGNWTDDIYLDRDGNVTSITRNLDVTYFGFLKATERSSITRK